MEQKYAQKFKIIIQGLGLVESWQSSNKNSDWHKSILGEADETIKSNYLYIKPANIALVYTNEMKEQK